MNKRWSILVAILSVIAVVIFFSCSKEEDRRKSVERDYGKPDYVEQGGFSAYKYEMFVYASRDINIAYQFRKSASGCGGSGEWYIESFYYADYMGYSLYSSPSITHEPIKTSTTGSKILLSAEIDDVESHVTQVNLYFRTPDQEEFTTAVMLNDGEDANIYYGEIPADSAVSGSQIYYYIESAYHVDVYQYGTFLSDTDKTLKTPKKNYYTVNISDTVAKPVFGPAETEPSPELRVPGKFKRGISPVSP